MSDLILQTNPKEDYLAYKNEIDEAINRVLVNGWYILGQEVKEFEKEFATYLNVGYCFGVASGTDALVVALKACGIGIGDTVLTVSHTAVATVSAIELTGATPVFVDICKETYTMDPDKLEQTLDHLFSDARYINLRPKAIIPVHIYGHPVDISRIIYLAKQYNLFVIEDCAQSHGATINGKLTGSFGDIAAFSFYPTKNLGALGDGGAVVTNNEVLAEKVGMIREYGWKERYLSDIPGMNSRLDELQAAILRIKLKYLAASITRREEIANFYNQHFNNLPLVLPHTQSGYRHAFHLYVIRTQQRDSLKNYLWVNKIHTLIHYPVPVHLQIAYKDRLPQPLPLEVTEQISHELLSLPNYPQLSDNQLQTVVDILCLFPF